MCRLEKIVLTDCCWVGDGRTDIRCVLVVQDAGLSSAANLHTLKVLLVRARLGRIRVTVENGLLIALEELQLELFGVDHRWAQVEVLAL